MPAHTPFKFTLAAAESACMPVRVPLAFVSDAMRLARPVTDAEGRVIAGAGTTLDERVRRLLRRLAIQAVVVEGADGLGEWEAMTPVPSQLADLDARFGIERDAVLSTLRDAIARHVTRRAARLGVEVDP